VTADARVLELEAALRQVATLLERARPGESSERRELASDAQVALAIARAATRQAAPDALDLQAPLGVPCTKAPHGWYCTRQRGHSGPCAALPDPAADLHTSLESALRGILRAPSASAYDLVQQLIEQLERGAAVFALTVPTAPRGRAGEVHDVAPHHHVEDPDGTRNLRAPAPVGAFEGVDVEHALAAASARAAELEAALEKADRQAAEQERIITTLRSRLHEFEAAPASDDDVDALKFARDEWRDDYVNAERQRNEAGATLNRIAELLGRFEAEGDDALDLVGQALELARDAPAARRLR